MIDMDDCERTSSRYMASYGFDGVDIAFEFPDEEVPEDKTALTQFLEVRDQRMGLKDMFEFRR
jgi:GH18 family chitinase